MNPLIKNYVAEDATNQYLIAKQGTADNQTLKSNAAAAGTIGIVCQPGTVSIGDRVDVVLMGEAEVLCGGAITAGASITSDASGKAVVAITGQRAVGIALETGASDRVIHCLVSPHIA